MALSALGFKIQSDKTILKNCWNALRQNKEHEKFMIVTGKLEVDTIPALESVKMEVHNMRVKKQLVEKTRSTSLFVKCFGKLLAQYFNRWK